MFTQTIVIPKVTASTFEAIELITPGFLALTNATLIETMDDALTIATKKVAVSLTKHEYISKKTSPIITETAAGWSILFTIAGD